MHTIQFLGLNPAGGDNTAFVDEVAITAQTQLDQRRQFRGAGTGREHLPVRAHRFGLAVLRRGRGGQQWQRFTSSNPNAPDGTQVAFVQGNGSMSQSLYLDAGTYSLSFLAAQRGGSSQLHYQEFQVLVDGVQVGSITPASTSYFSYQTPSFTVTAGVHTVQFLGLNPAGGDNTAFIDQVQIPSSSLA